MQLLLPLLLLLPTLLDRPTADRPCAKNIHHHAIEGSVKDFFCLKGVSVLGGKNPIKGIQKRMNIEDPQKLCDYCFYTYLNFTVCTSLDVSI